MRIAVFILGATAAAFFASSVEAQYDPQKHRAEYLTENLAVSVSHLHARLNDGVRNGSITIGEARPIRKHLQTIDDLSRLGNFTRSDHAFLQRRVRDIRRELQNADDGANGRFAKWDGDDDLILGPRPDALVDANNDGWDDRDFNRNGYWYDDPQPFGIGTGSLGDGGIRVGQRVSADLYSVPYPYQDLYHDNSEIYYRSDGYRIYGINRHNQKVVRIFRI